jgi:hypothetical protein
MLIEISSLHCRVSRSEFRMKSHNKIDNSSFEKAEQFTYLGTTLTNQNSIRKKLRAD